MPAEIWPCTNEQYHADRTAISHSALDTFIESPPRFFGRYVAQPGEPGYIESKPTAAMLIGTAFHHLILEPDQPAPFSVCPEALLGKNGAKSTNTWRDFAAGCEAQGKFAITPDEMEQLEAMRDSALAVPVVRRLFESQGRPELSVKFECPETGLPLKSRIDWLLENKIVDVKTCQSADPREFAKAAYNYGYHRQAAFYTAAVHALTGYWLDLWFVAVEKEPPYTCELIELSEQSEELGKRQNEAGLRRLAAAIESGEWTTPSFNQLVTISLPNFAFTDDQWSL